MNHIQTVPTLTDVRGRRFSVLGIARSGVAAANALVRRGADVVASDLRAEAALADALARLDPRVAVVTGENRVREGDTVIISPGIKPGSPAFREAHARGAAVWSDVELFGRMSPAPVLAITGTDGKSTTTALLGEIVRAGGRPVFVGGNIGIPLMGGLDELTPGHVVVAEVSCFQLVHCPTLRPRVAVYTNIAVDHVDYHGSYEAYQAAKRLLVANQTRSDTIVWNADDAELRHWTWPVPPRRWAYSRLGPVEAGLHAMDGVVTAAMDGATFPLIGTDEIRIPGPHNLENAMAAAGAALAFGIEPEAVADTLRAFPGLEHRIEHTATIGAVGWYNDSKATNPHAALAGLTAFGERPMVVIAGGSEKGSDFGEVGQVLAARARGVVLIGQTRDRIAAAIAAAVADRGAPAGGGPPVVKADTLEGAIAAAHDLARGEGVVTLCPVCASFDMFQDYEDRGRQFKEAVRRFAAERAGA
jgi:UDP-N-acetylmuramoylalanine--D-glutamate ligase